MKQASKMRLSSLLALGAKPQTAVPLEWPKEFGAYTAKSSEEIPPFPSTLSGFQSEERKDFWNNPFDTKGSIRIFQDNDWEGLWDFPLTMNGCSHGVFMIRWRSTDQNIRVHSVVAYSADVAESEKMKTGVFGYMSGTNCEQPMFKFADSPYRVQGSLLVDLFYELKFWPSSPVIPVLCSPRQENQNPHPEKPQGAPPANYQSKC